MFANIKYNITVFNEHLFDVCEYSSKCEKRLCLAGPLLELFYNSRSQVNETKSGAHAVQNWDDKRTHSTIFQLVKSF